MTFSNLGLTAAVVLLLAAPALAQDHKAPEAPAGEPKQAEPVKRITPPPSQMNGTQLPRMPSNSWFEVTDQDLGTFFGEGEANGKFVWTNPTDQAVDWSNLQGSCQCIRAVIRAGDREYQLRPKHATPLVRVSRDAQGREQTEAVAAISIQPRETGSIEVFLDMHGITGPKMATLDVHTTDPGLQHFKLRWTATGAQLFAIAPAEVQLNKMTWNEVKEFTVTVTSPLKKDFEITRMENAKAFDVKWEKKLNGELAVWTISGKYGPVGEDIAGGGVLKFWTDVNGGASFTIRVMAFVQGPLEVKPGGFLTLGMIKHGSALHKEIVFEPNDGTDLQLAGFRFEKLRGAEQSLKVSSTKDGNKLVLSFDVLDSAPKGLLKGDLVVELNHPLVKEKRILFNGYVR
ncbi:MAG: hypothetical protein JNL08_18420 [Planctomycetes bacterium]|nr:hypothetical protein [Planctomycetota bacterium]